MLHNYIKIAWRNIVRNKAYSAINIVGLAMGIMSCILILLYIQHELSYDKHFTHTEKIFRIVNNIDINSEEIYSAATPGPLAAKLKSLFPEVEQVTRVYKDGGRPVTAGNKALIIDHFIRTDTTFFSLFDYPFLAGTPETAFSVPNAVVLTQETADKLFGSAEAAYGQLVKFRNTSYQVTGIILNDKPSHLQFKVIFPLNSATMPLEEFKQVNSDWGQFETYTYLLLKQPEQAAGLQEKLPAFFSDYVMPLWNEESFDFKLTYRLQPLPSIYFDTEWIYDLSKKGNITYIYTFGVVAAFILLIASINYINLATARSSKRAKEVGMRKAIGAYRYQIMLQFIGESIILAGIAAMLAVVLVEIFLPVFNAVTNTSISSGFLLSSDILFSVIGLVLFIGLVAGSYPAFILSHFKPTDVLKASTAPKSGTAVLRKALVVFQFTISLVLIIGTVVVYSQMLHMKNASLGFDQEQVMAITVPNYTEKYRQNFSLLRKELQQQPSVVAVSSTQYVPGDQVSVSGFYVNIDGQTMMKTVNNMGVDYNYLDLMGIELLHGRNFSSGMQTDRQNSYVVNEAAVKAFGWGDSPVGKNISNTDTASGTVIGVVKDFHYKSLHSKIEPLILTVRPDRGYLLLRLDTRQNLTGVLNSLSSSWDKYYPDYPMEHYFLDEYFEQQYRAEEKMLTIFGYFAILTIIIACMGLFGLASFTAEQRTKEIGIRKVLGSSISGIVMLLTKDFALLVCIAILIASPIAWYGMQQWLQDFAYRTPISAWIFIFSGLIALAIAILTVSFKATRAAMADPVKALRTE